MSLFSALENYEEVEGVTVPEDASEVEAPVSPDEAAINVAEEIAENAELQAEVVEQEELDEEVEQDIAVQEGLEALYSQLSAIHQDNQMTPAVASMMMCSMEAYAVAMKTKFNRYQLPSVESFGDQYLSHDAVVASLEGIWDTIVGLGKKILEAIRAAGAWLKEKAEGMFDRTKAFFSKAEKLEKAVKEDKVAVNEEKVKEKAHWIVGPDGDLVKNLEEMKKVQKQLEQKLARYHQLVGEAVAQYGDSSSLQQASLDNNEEVQQLSQEIPALQARLKPGKASVWAKASKEGVLSALRAVRDLITGLNPFKKEKENALATQAKSEKVLLTLEKSAEQAAAVSGSEEEGGEAKAATPGLFRRAINSLGRGVLKVIGFVRNVIAAIIAIVAAFFGFVALFLAAAALGVSTATKEDVAEAMVKAAVGS